MKSMKGGSSLVRFGIVTLVFVLAGSLGSASRPGAQALPAESAPMGGQPLGRADGPGNTVFLPLLTRNYPDRSTFGIEIGALTDANGLQLMADAGTTWVRRAAVQWNLVEATEGVYDWSQLSGLETELVNAQHDHLKVILVVRGTPSWAQKVPGYTCGAILQSKFGAFAAFVSQLVTRYSVNPYDVLYWEIWNEPDTDPSEVADPNSAWGCWGDVLDQIYYGGDYYASMLQAVYPAVKTANPYAQVLVGGLLLSCDPNAPAAPLGKPCSTTTRFSSRFIEGVLHGGGGPYFDGIAFHAYDYYGPNLGVYANSNWASVWNTTGPVVFAKADYIKGLLTTYGVTGKFLMNTEAAVVCVPAWGNVCDSTWEATKAYFLAEEYAAGIKLGLRATIWYPWSERHAELYESDLTTLPAYDAYAAERRELADGTYVRDITEFAGLKGYEVQRRDRKVWILWAVDGGSHSISLPGTPLAAFDVYGASLPIPSPFPVARAPVYLEWNP